MDDDARQTELEALRAIYPEIRQPDASKDPFTFEVDIPVHPEAPVTVSFPAAIVGDAAAATDPGHPEEDSLRVSHLPALALRMSLVDGYPSDAPPDVRLSTHPQWLGKETLSRLESDVNTVWEEMGRDLVAYAYIDHLQRSADNVFGAVGSSGTLEVDPQFKLAVLDHDIKAKKAAFDKDTFHCGVCLDPKKGTKCHKMLDCGHVFCLQCLQDFYNDAIEAGNISTVRCLSPNCAKERAAALVKDGKKTGKPKTSISPSELLQIGLDEESVKRYVMLKYKTELESDKNTIYCPRRWCGGAARSERHKKPSGLEFAEASDPEPDDDDDNDRVDDEADRSVGAKGKKDKKVVKVDPADLLAVCEDCGFAFCRRCCQTWHGEFARCTPKRDKEELTAEEKASLEYLQLHTSLCPTCESPSQKTHGCNHMICPRCDTHFCYLCSAWLDPGNPYRHYNQDFGGKVTGCYMRLWELEGGDGDDVGLDFAGGRALPPAVPAGRRRALVREETDDDDEDEDDDNDRNVPRRRRQQQQQQQQQNNNRRAAAQPLDQNGRPLAVAREAPLVLRLVDDHANDAAPAPREPPPAAAAAAGGRGNANVARRGAGGGDAPRGRRGGRGFGRGLGGGRAPRGRGRGAAVDAAPRLENRDGAGEADANANAEWGAAQEAWVARFVQMALLDAEDELEDDDEWDQNDDLFLIQ